MIDSIDARLLADLEKSRLIPVVAIQDPDLAIPLANAILDGGIKFIEITFRTSEAESALIKLKDVNTGIHIGAGTVRTLDQAKRAIAEEVEFLVSPGFNKKLIKYAIDENVAFFPGVDSTIGIENSISLGLKTMKFFPAAAAGGIKWLKAMSGPYYDIKFIPTGGINLDNLKTYLGLANVIAIGGSFLAPRNLISKEKFREITRICQSALEIARSIEKPGES
ncbi:MAG: bifunctional 4-hydroxy-2-oxoglutarate aldolase/2-dehydro-3-deoxy-phosphogluconate aldolase [Promethearchaeota archaeon]